MNFRGITFPQGSTQKVKELVLPAAVLRMLLKFLETQGRIKAQVKEQGQAYTTDSAPVWMEASVLATCSKTFS